MNRKVSAGFMYGKLFAFYLFYYQSVYTFYDWISCMKLLKCMPLSKSFNTGKNLGVMKLPMSWAIETHCAVVCKKVACSLTSLHRSIILDYQGQIKSLMTQCVSYDSSKDCLDYLRVWSDIIICNMYQNFN